MAFSWGRGGRTLRLFLSVLSPVLVGALGGWATSQGVVDWYPSLVKPSFNPPAWVFGPVWTALYLLMGLALFLVWERARDSSGLRPEGKKALLIFGVQLILNAAWSFLFFGARSPGWALLDLVLLWVFILWTLLLFLRIHRLAGWLLAPYLAWVTFAGALNFAIFTLNG